MSYAFFSKRNNPYSAIMSYAFFSERNNPYSAITDFYIRYFKQKLIL